MQVLEIAAAKLMGTFGFHQCSRFSRYLATLTYLLFQPFYKIKAFVIDFRCFLVSCRYRKWKRRNFQANFIILEFSVFRNFSLFLASFVLNQVFILISVKLIINFCLKRGGGRRN